MTPRFLVIRYGIADKGDAAHVSGAGSKTPRRDMTPPMTIGSRMVLAAGCGALIAAFADTVINQPSRGLFPSDHAETAAPSTRTSLLQKAEVRMMAGHLLQ